MQTEHENFLDIPLIEPRLKHPTILRVFDSLSAGESLTIHNNHDPEPVYHQLLGERGDVFIWQYLQQGPEWWDVRITKKGEDDAETIGQIAAKDLRKAEVFKKYGIDFCCGGKKTLREVCSEKGIDAAKIEQELQQAQVQSKTTHNSYNDWNPDFLADYIVNIHHNYIRKHLPDLRNYALKVARVHGQHHPELLEIQKLVEDIGKELTEHIEQEENVLFAYIKNLVQSKDSSQQINKEGENLETLIEGMEKEHDFAGRCFDKIRAFSQDYAIPEDGCTSYRMLFNMLQEFENDLHLHIHLENNILFPKALKMEKSIMSH